MRQAATIGSVNEVITGEVLSKLYGSPITVLRTNGRIFVLADEIEVDGEAHSHEENVHEHHHHP